MSDTQSNNKRIAKNTLYLYIRMIITTVVSLYTVRVVLDVLGAEDYGIYNVVGGIVVLFSFLNHAMNGATQRFLSYEIGRTDVPKDIQHEYQLSCHNGSCDFRNIGNGRSLVSMYSDEYSGW